MFFDPGKIGYETCAYIGLYLKDPESFDSSVAKPRALEHIPEVVECHLLPANMICLLKYMPRTNHHLLEHYP